MRHNTFRKWSIFAAVALIGIGLCLICGCTGESGRSETTTPTATPAGSATSPAGTGPVTAVHFTELYQFFPTPTSNWVAEDPFGYSVAADGMSWSWAGRTYQHKVDDIMVDIVIQDTAETREGYWEMWDTFSGSIDTPDISMKSTTVQGYPAWVVHDKAANTYTQFVAINDRFIVWTNVEGSSAKETHLTVFNNQMDIEGIGKLG
jgi:hypothetical protein